MMVIGTSIEIGMISLHAKFSLQIRTTCLDRR
jgi:hypothetical protein